MKRDKYEQAVEGYYSKHTKCPTCGNSTIVQSLMNYVLDLKHKNTFKDGNTAECTDCKWNGKVHDLV